jgi:hypothetical protein
MSQSEELVCALGRFFDAIEAEDLPAAMGVVEDVVDPDVEFNSVIADAFEGSVYRGHAGVRSWFGDLIDTFDVEYGDREFRETDEETILFLSRMKLRGKASGADVPREIGVVVVHHAGIVRRVNSFGTHAEAIEAAAAKESADA